MYNRGTKIEDRRSKVDNCEFHSALSSILHPPSSIFCFLSWVVPLWLFVPFAQAQDASVVIDSLRVDGNYLVMDFHADSLLNHHLLGGMQRGLTSSAQFRVQLWRKRGRFLGSSLVTDRQYEVKSTYEPWEQKYVLITAEERRLTNSLELVRQRWEQHHGVKMAELAQLNPAHRYFVIIELLVEPVSRENLNEIRAWLAGEVKSVTRRDSTNAADDAKREGIQNRLLEFILNLTGFGKRIISEKSGIFRVAQNGGIELEKK
jgi:hypothetical protein